MTIVSFAVLLSISFAAAADESGAVPEDWSVHGQVTHVWQYHPAFKAKYSGPNSLDPGSRANETFDVTLFLGVRPWSGAEIWVNPEIDQGFGLSNTLGVAGYTSGEAYKVGASSPYFRLQRIFLRQTVNLGGSVEPLESDANQLGGTRAADNLIVTAGKFSTTDIFDTNTYAHDPKKDFLNWAIIDAGVYDYAADAWGYSYGVAAELTQSGWTLRLGLFDLSRVPNTPALETTFGQFELVAELEERHELLGLRGKLKLLGFVNRGRFGSYNDALHLAQLTSSIPDTSLVRKYTSRPGVTLNLEQQITDDVGAFVRIGINDGSKEADEFTEINRTISVGFSLSGSRWGRANDAVGIAGVVNSISTSARTYLAVGGLGILIGDGKLSNYGTEDILEAYYSASLTPWLTASADYQLIANPAYNADRGPVSVLGARLHAEFCFNEDD